MDTIKSEKHIRDTIIAKFGNIKNIDKLDIKQINQNVFSIGSHGSIDVFCDGNGDVILNLNEFRQSPYLKEASDLAGYREVAMNDNTTYLYHLSDIDDN